LAIDNEINMPDRQFNRFFDAPSAIDKEVDMPDFQLDPLFDAAPAVDTEIEMAIDEPQPSSSSASGPKRFRPPPLLAARQ
jgi:hypothetical protein